MSFYLQVTKARKELDDFIAELGTLAEPPRLNAYMEKRVEKYATIALDVLREFILESTGAASRESLVFQEDQPFDVM